MRLITAVASASIYISMRRQVQCLQAYIVSTAVSVHLGSLCVHLVYRYPTACHLTTCGGVCRARRGESSQHFCPGRSSSGPRSTTAWGHEVRDGVDDAGGATALQMPALMP